MKRTTRAKCVLAIGLLVGLAMAAAAQANAAQADDGDAERPAAASPVEIPVTGAECPELAAFDRLMVDTLREHEIPGAALALTRQGRLVYARGFGWADREAQTPVEPDALFRLASVSKPITGLAIMQLVERGKIQLDDRVVDVLGLASDLAAVGNADPRWNQVTIRQLLQHSGGWDRDKSFDPMFQAVEFAKKLGTPPPAGPNEVIRAMLDVPLDFDPGERYAYSNFGYCLLGRVIERVSGQAYEDYVRSEVLAPLGAQAMRLGRSLREHRAPGEVSYYDNGVTSPAVMGPEIGAKVSSCYGAWHLEAMDAHGAWLGSVGDLARVAVTLDRPDACPILKGTSIETMFARPDGGPGHDKDGPKAVYYGCGWQVRPQDDGTFNSWHSGSLPGTSTMLVRRFDGHHFIVLFNTRRTKGPEQPARLVEGPLHEAINAVETWPDRNLWDN